MTAARESVETADGDIALALPPYASRLVVFRRDAGRAAPARSATALVASTELRSGWSVSFGETARAEPPITVDLPWSWADVPERRYFSGTATFRRTVEAPTGFGAPGTRVWLDFGEP